MRRAIAFRDSKGVRLTTIIRMGVAAVILGESLLHKFESDAQRTAYFAAIASGLVYSIWAHFFQQRASYKWIRTRWLNVVFDTAFLTTLIGLSGGATSPLYLAWFAGIAGCAYHFRFRGALLVTLIYSIAYVGVVAFLGQLDTHALEMSLRIAFMFLTACASGPIAEEADGALASMFVACDAYEQANLAKTNFLASMSHEIRTPLSAMLGFTELLGDRRTRPEDRRRYVETIKRNGKQLSRLIDDILDLTRVESGQLSIDTSKPVHVSQLVADVVSMFSPQAEAAGVGLFSVVEPGTPTEVGTDGFRVRQILTQLVGNALKFTDRGAVTILVRSAAGRLEISVRDTGKGIVEIDRELLFTQFFQADHSLSRRHGGTGLGLSLSKRLAEALGGSLRLTWSEAGIGSCFTLTLPFAEIAAHEDALPIKDVTAPVALDDYADKLNGVRVLIADDARDNRELTARILRTAGAKVQLASDGVEAIERALNSDCDLILLDLEMPRLDGFSAARQLRQSGFSRPIVALSGHGSDEASARAFTSGCTEYLVKPLSYSSLIATVDRLVHIGPETHETLPRYVQPEFPWSNP